jgi:16S rRNA (adenine1518-N6/adenine1519-N6)-dimethyltransferase
VHRAKKSLGQNFLVDPGAQRRIVAALEPAPHDEVLEIGPGRGALTRHLVGKVRRLVAVELDDALVEAARTQFGAGVEVVHGDVLELPLERLSADIPALKVVGNIPYNITTPLIFHLLERRPRPPLIVLMVQREVADRILAQPGGKEYGALTVGVRSVAEVERLFHVPRGAFRPAPNVDSTVVRIRPHAPPRLSQQEEADLRRLTRTAFAWRRKQLQKILRSAPGYGLSPAALAAVAAETGLSLDARPETLAPDRFIALARALRRWQQQPDAAPRENER